MNLPYDPAEAIHIISGLWGSAADALSLATGAVPKGKFWTFQAASVIPSVAETRIFWWNVVNPSGTIEVAMTIPLSIALSSTRGLPLLSPGDEFILLPGQSLQARRDAATAGSSMYIYALYIEADMPLYEYIEPQEKRRLRRSAREVMRDLPRAIGGRPINGGFVGSRPGDIDGGGRGLEK